jgi:hypothetical protein
MTVTSGWRDEKSSSVVKRPASVAPERLAEVKSLAGIRVIDEIDDMALLMEADEGALERHADRLSGFTVAPEGTYDLPKNPSKPKAKGGLDDD